VIDFAEVQYSSILFLGMFAKLRKSDYELHHACLSVHPHGTTELPVRPRGTTRLPLDGFFMKFDIRVFFKNLSRNFKFYQNLMRIMGILYECQ